MRERKVITMEQIQYIKLDDKFIKLHTEFDEYSVVKGDAYLVDDQIYIYRGKYIKSQQPKPTGLYLKDNGVFTKVGKSDISKDSIVKNKNNDSLNSLLSNIRSMEVAPSSKTKNTSNSKISVKKVSTKEKRKLENNKRIKRDEVLNFTIFNEDDPMVRIIKEKINSISLTMSDIYSAVESDSVGYNLFYGLSTRPNMTWKTFEIWCNILEVEPNLTIKDKD